MHGCELCRQASPKALMSLTTQIDPAGDDAEPRARGAGGGAGGGGGGSGRTRLWIYGGRVYNYNPKKPDTIEVSR